MSNTSNDVRGRETRINYQLIRNVTSSEEKENGVQTYVANLAATELTKIGTEDNLRTYIPEHSNKRRNAVHKGHRADDRRRAVSVHQPQFRRYHCLLACDDQ